MRQTYGSILWGYETAIDIVLSRAILAYADNCSDRELRKAIDVVMLAHPSALTQTGEEEDTFQSLGQVVGRMKCVKS